MKASTRVVRDESSRALKLVMRTVFAHSVIVPLPRGMMGESSLHSRYHAVVSGAGRDDHRSSWSLQVPSGMSRQLATSEVAFASSSAWRTHSIARSLLAVSAVLPASPKS